MLRVVLDTNIFVSSLLIRSGPPARLIDAWRAMKLVPIVSPAMLGEIRAVLNYPRIRSKYVISDQAVDELISLLATDAVLVRGEAQVSGTIPGDPQDEASLVCGLEGQADLIVSGDRHLLRLGAYEGMPIVTARRLLEQLDLK